VLRLGLLLVLVIGAWVAASALAALSPPAGPPSAPKAASAAHAASGAASRHLSPAVAAASAASGAASAAAASASAASAAQAAASAAEDDTLVEPPPPPSPLGQRVYEAARSRLVQVRTVLKSQGSQSTVGSGFVVSDDGHLITNYHVISSYALQPDAYQLAFTTADGVQGALRLIDIDVVHDLALLQAADPQLLAGLHALPFRPPTLPLARGERLFSLGNPLDVGFAVAEGSYNGLVERSFVPVIFFGGALSPGVSGGPTLDARGRVIGINVATRRDGEQISFLVPAVFAQQLLQRRGDAPPMALPAYPAITRQLMVHQDALTRAFLALPWRQPGHTRYAIPVPREDFLRCWGRSTPPDTRGLELARSDCQMEGRIFIKPDLGTGFLSIRHELYDGRNLGWLRFAQRYSASFRNEYLGGNSPYFTAAQCHERFVDRDGLPLRAVVCLRAHTKLRGLYELTVLVATLDQDTAGVQGRFDAHGVSFANAQALTAHYLSGFGWTQPRLASR
jgi:S1-C subfamily serine protease